MVQTPQWLRNRWQKLPGFFAVRLRWLRDRWQNRAAWLIPGFLVVVFFAAIGWFTGWYVGESQVPVVAIFIPVIAGLLGGVGVALYDRKATTEKAVKIVQDLTAQNPGLLGASSQLDSKLNEPSWWILVFWMLSVTAFCGFSFWGFHKGVDFRVPKYRALTELTRGTEDKPTNPRPEEMGVLQELTWHLQSNHVPAAEVDSLFKNTINPLLAKKELEPSCRLSTLTWTVDRILKLERSKTSIPCSMQPKPPSQPPEYHPSPPSTLSPLLLGTTTFGSATTFGLATTPLPSPLSALPALMWFQAVLPPIPPILPIDLTRRPMPSQEAVDNDQ